MFDNGCYLRRQKRFKCPQKEALRQAQKAGNPTSSTTNSSNNSNGSNIASESRSRKRLDSPGPQDDSDDSSTGHAPLQSSGNNSSLSPMRNSFGTGILSTPCSQAQSSLGTGENRTQAQTHYPLSSYNHQQFFSFPRSQPPSFISGEYIYPSKSSHQLTNYYGSRPPDFLSGFSNSTLGCGSFYPQVQPSSIDLNSTENNLDSTYSFQRPLKYSEQLFSNVENDLTDKHTSSYLSRSESSERLPKSKSSRSPSNMNASVLNDEAFSNPSSAVVKSEPLLTLLSSSVSSGHDSTFCLPSYASTFYSSVPSIFSSSGVPIPSLSTSSSSASTYYPSTADGLLSYEKLAQHPSSFFMYNSRQQSQQHHNHHHQHHQSSFQHSFSINKLMMEEQAPDQYHHHPHHHHHQQQQQNVDSHASDQQQNLCNPMMYNNNNNKNSHDNDDADGNLYGNFAQKSSARDHQGLIERQELNPQSNGSTPSHYNDINYNNSSNNNNNNRDSMICSSNFPINWKIVAILAFQVILNILFFQLLLSLHDFGFINLVNKLY